MCDIKFGKGCWIFNSNIYFVISLWSVVFNEVRVLYIYWIVCCILSGGIE